MSEEQKPTAAAPKAAAQPAAAAPRPAAAAKPAAPAKPAVNELKPALVEPAALRAELERLRREEGMDFLLNLTGVDWMEEGLGAVYQLENTTNGKQAAVKAVCADRENPMLPSVCDLWDIAHTYEREVYDFYGIIFTNHPDMRRLFMREDWVGFPFRKDDETEKNNPLRMTNEPLSDFTREYRLTEDGRVETVEHRIWGRGGLCGEHRPAAPLDPRRAALPRGPRG